MLKRYLFFGISLSITIMILLIPASLTLMGGRSTVERRTPLEEYRSLEEIRSLSSEGIKIASHSSYRTDLNKMTSQEVNEGVEEDLSRFNEAGVEPDYYFPSSYRYDGRVLEALQEHSDDLGFSTSLPPDIIGNESAPPPGLFEISDQTQNMSYEYLVGYDPSVIVIGAGVWNEGIERSLKDYLEHLLEERSSVKLVIQDIDADIQESKLEKMINSMLPYHLKGSYSPLEEIILAVRPETSSVTTLQGIHSYMPVWMRIPMESFYVLGFFLTSTTGFFFFLTGTLESEKKKEYPEELLTLQKRLPGAQIGKIKEKLGGGYAPKVSIILPCFNESEGVGRAIESCYFQDYEGKIEVVVVDDGSLDNTYDIAKVQESSHSDRDVKVRHKPNSGKADALNFGLKHATGNIVFHTDGDTEMEKEAVRKVVKKFKRYPEAGGIGGFVAVRNEENLITKVQQIEYLYGQHLLRQIQGLDGNVVIMPGAITALPKKVAKEFPMPKGTLTEDAHLTIQLLSAGFETRYARDTRVWTNVPEKFSDWWKQRTRWLYGFLQIWTRERGFMSKNPWSLFYIGRWYLSFFTFGLLLLVGLLSPFVSGGAALLNFLSLRFFIVISGYLVTRSLILQSYGRGARFIKYSLTYLVYGTILELLRLSLLFRYVTRIGLKIEWGGREIEVKR
ncbi:MAG: glycosyltransferase [Candidatus Thermoplasmatota archaeon]|nr:glycosyltransferase [Candidatus Thermoplasmatota archaeon]